jgi:hypothetical protein
MKWTPYTDNEPHCPEIRRKYSEHRNRAVHKGIGWEFTLAAWWLMWQGEWMERGPCLDQKVMARNGDTGPYSPDNCRIVTARENHREWFHNKTKPNYYH